MMSRGMGRRGQVCAVRNFKGLHRLDSYRRRRSEHSFDSFARLAPDLRRALGFGK